MEILKIRNYPYATMFKIRKTEIEKIDFVTCEQPSETLEHFYNRQELKPDFLCNGGFFSLSAGTPVFTFVDNGKEEALNRNYLEGCGVRDNELVLDTYNRDYSDFISAYPVFMKNGSVVNTGMASDIDYNARRTILGYDDSYIYVITVELPGYAFAKIRTMLTKLKIPNAINLDGGGSTRVLVNGERKTEQVYSRPVDNVVAIYFKKKKTIYRVQTGAFIMKANAEKYRDEIAKLPDTIGAEYKNAYVRLVNDLYKVQVGAFSKRENAERVVADLKEKGYNSFITT